MEMHRIKSNICGVSIDVTLQQGFLIIPEKTYKVPIFIPRTSFIT